MYTKDLIKILEKLIKDNKPHENILGEHEIMIDIFGLIDSSDFKYLGFSGDIRITKSADGVYDILTAFAISEEKQNK